MKWDNRPFSGAPGASSGRERIAPAASTSRPCTAGQKRSRRLAPRPAAIPAEASRMPFGVGASRLPRVPAISFKKRRILRQHRSPKRQSPAADALRGFQSARRGAPLCDPAHPSSDRFRIATGKRSDSHSEEWRHAASFLPLVSERSRGPRDGPEVRPTGLTADLAHCRERGSDRPPAV